MVVCFLCGVIAVLAVLQHFERRDLYNRIIPKNMSEHKSGAPSGAVSGHKKVLEKWREVN